MYEYVWLAGAHNALGDNAAARMEAAEVERIVALSPNSAPSYSALAWTMNYTDRPADALVAG